MHFLLLLELYYIGTADMLVFKETRVMNKNQNGQPLPKEQPLPRDWNLVLMGDL